MNNRRDATLLRWLFAGGLSWLAGPVVAWAQPLPTEGLIVHLVADELSGADGSAVARWMGAGRVVAEQSDPARQPIVIVDALNGHRAVRFDGIDDGLILSENVFAASQIPKTVFAVVRSSDTYGHVIGTGSAINGLLPTFGYGLVLLGGKAAIKANLRGSGLLLMTTETWQASTAQLVSGFFSAAASRLETNCQVAQSDASPDAFDYSTSTLGSTGSGIDPLAGDIAEILVYDRELTPTDVDAVQTLLAARYAIARVDPTIATQADVDLCDPASRYLNNTQMTVTLVAPATLTSGAIENVIDATSPREVDPHSQASHVWLAGPELALRFDLPVDYDIRTLHFWNYPSDDFDVDLATFTFLTADDSVVGAVSVMPEAGLGDIYSQSIPLAEMPGVRAIRAVLSGTNDRIDFQNLGFTGRPSVADALFSDGFENP